MNKGNKKMLGDAYKDMDLPKGIVTKKSVREIFTYEDGELFYKKRFHPRIRIDKPAGSVQSNGYLRVSIGKRKYQIHTLVWVYHNGVHTEEMVDHKDRNRLNNSIDNLRPVTRQLNNENRIGKGWVYDKKRNRFVARITIKGKQIQLGRFKTPEEANAAYLAAKKVHHEVE